MKRIIQSENILSTLNCANTVTGGGDFPSIEVGRIHSHSRWPTRAVILCGRIPQNHKSQTSGTAGIEFISYDSLARHHEMGLTSPTR